MKRISLLIAALSFSTLAWADKQNPVLESLRLPEQPAPSEYSIYESLRLPEETASEEKPVSAGMDLANEFALSCLMAGGKVSDIEDALKARSAVQFPDEVLEEDEAQPGLRGYQLPARLGYYNVIFDEAGHCTVSANLALIDEPLTTSRAKELLIDRLKAVQVEEKFPQDTTKITSISAFEMDVGNGAVMKVSLYKAAEVGQTESIFMTRKILLLAPEKPGE
jgi:hypothetical protein